MMFTTFLLHWVFRIYIIQIRLIFPFWQRKQRNTGLTKNKTKPTNPEGIVKALSNFYFSFSTMHKQRVYDFTHI